MSQRDELESRVKACCPAEWWYQMQDTIDETPDCDLIRFLECYEEDESKTEERENKDNIS